MEAETKSTNLNQTQTTSNLIKNKIDKNNTSDENDKKINDLVIGKNVTGKQKLADIEKKNGIKGTLMNNLNIENPDSELLGSVTTYPNIAGSDSVHTVRTSARVIQKMRDSKRGQTPPPTPPVIEKNSQSKEDRTTPNIQNQPKTHRDMWSNIERNLFFEALNEYGKDFDAIAHYMNTKLKRQHTPDTTFKIKKTIRLLYCQIFYKVLKYVKFSDEVRKVAQELYGLINYGEMRRKLSFVNDKVLMKLGELVYKGSVSFRIKGKTIKIRTPSCRALRELNQLEEWQEEIKLPAKVEVHLRPANLEAWGKVQNLAQNPRIKTILPLQKRVGSFLKFLQQKWKSQELRLCEKTLQMQTLATYNKINNRNKPIDVEMSPVQLPLPDEQKICIAPTPGAVIHRPMVYLKEFLRSYRICLNSYEERIDAKVRGETLCLAKTNSKRQRHDSNSEKKSPDLKKIKIDTDIKPLETCDKLEKVPIIDIIKEPDDITENKIINMEEITENSIIKAEEMTDTNDTIIKEDTEIIENETKVDKQMSSNDELEVFLEESSATFSKFIAENLIEENRLNRKKEKTNNKKKDNRRDSTSYRPLISEETIKQIRDGWNLSTIGDLTFGDLYIMFGQDIKLSLEYSWCKVKEEPITKKKDVTNNTPEENPIEKPIDETSSILGGKLKQLLLIANMSEKGRKKSNCICGHVCDKTVKMKRPDDSSSSYISNKIHSPSQNDNMVFRQPTLPVRISGRISGLESFKLYLNNMRKQPRWLNSRHRPAFPSKQVVVQRLLPLQPGVNPSYGVVTNETTQNPHDLQQFIEIKEKEIIETIKKSNENEPIVKNNNNNNNSVDNDKRIDKNNKTDDNNKNINLTEENNGNRYDLESTDNSVDINPGITSLMDISLPPSPLYSNSDDDRFEEYISVTSPMSPMRILREIPEGSNSQFHQMNDVNDFSFSSFLGHLDQMSDSERKHQESNDDMDSNLSVISDTSIDYMSKFAQIAAEFSERENNNLKNNINDFL